MKKILSIVLIFILIFQQPALAVKAKSVKRKQRTQQTQEFQQAQQTFPVPINKLANYKSLKKKMTDAEFKQAYDVALKIVTPIAEWSREEQIKALRAI